MKIGALVLFICATVFLHAHNRVDLLSPPQLEPETIAKEIPCVRPMREGIFNISSEDVEEKFVVHCFGHGGCGWTTFLGSVEEAIELFQRRYPSPETAPAIRVIGAGCMGLCSAIELSRRGYHVVGISAKELYDIPSWNAAGYFAVVSVKISPEQEDMVKRINFFTFHAYQQVERGEHPYLSSASTRFIPVYCSAETHAGVEDLEEQGLIPPREVVDIDFGNGVVHHNYNKFMTYFFDVTTLMQDLHKEVSRLGIVIEREKVGSFAELSEEVVFNCGGLGGGDLAQDSKMIPVRGHLLMLNEKAGSDHMDYMIYTKVMQEEKDEYVYLFPRTSYIIPQSGNLVPANGVLGGSFIIGAEKLPQEELAELDQIEFARLKQRNREFFYGK